MQSLIEQGAHPLNLPTKDKAKVLVHVLYTPYRKLLLQEHNLPTKDKTAGPKSVHMSSYTRCPDYTVFSYKGTKCPDEALDPLTGLLDSGPTSQLNKGQKLDLLYEPIDD